MKRGKDYGSDRYWETEQPSEATTASHKLAYFRNAGKFQVMRQYTDHAGQVRRGRNVTMDRREFRSSPEAVALIRRFLNDAAMPADE